MWLLGPQLPRHDHGRHPEADALLLLMASLQSSLQREWSSLRRPCFEQPPQEVEKQALMGGLPTSLGATGRS